MIIVPGAQQTEEWFAGRRGIPSASNADKILSPTGIPSKQADGYANQLIAERLTGLSGGFEGNTHTTRGTELEPEARAYYGFVSGTEVAEVGFCVTDAGTFGCSPDGLCDEDGMLEIKCPSPAVHVGYLLGWKVPTTYLAQVQSQLFVTGRRWCDFLSFHPDLPPLLVRVTPDLKWHAKFSAELEKFTALLASKMAALKEKGDRMTYVRHLDPQFEDPPEAPEEFPCPRHRFNRQPKGFDCWFCEQDREVIREDRKANELEMGTP